MDGRIIVAGGGLGGLTAAACLLKAGIDVDVYEQAPRLGEVGAGIQISANAGRVFRHLDLYDAIAEAGVLPSEYRFRTYQEGDVLQRIPLGEGYRERHGAPYVTVHRADLHALLVDRVRALKSDAIHTGATVTGFEEDGKGVTVHFADRAAERSAALIGADGIKSVIRPLIVGADQATYSGDAVWRVIVPTERLPAEFRLDTVDIWVGPRRHAVTYPLRRGTLMNLGGCVEYDRWEEESWVTPRPWQEMKEDFEGWHPMICAIIDAANRDECYRWALRIREPVTNWSTGRATLLGDAAHPTLPYMAQGAAMAIEDGAVLARAFAAEDDVGAAIRLYQRNRLDRTTRVIRESSANRTLFHLDTVDKLREAFSRRDMNAERTAWLFSYDPLSVELT